jgi:hypothetical protein
LLREKCYAEEGCDRWGSLEGRGFCVVVLRAEEKKVVIVMFMAGFVAPLR